MLGPTRCPMNPSWNLMSFSLSPQMFHILEKFISSFEYYSIFPQVEKKLSDDENLDGQFDYFIFHV